LIIPPSAEPSIYALSRHAIQNLESDIAPRIGPTSEHHASRLILDAHMFTAHLAGLKLSIDDGYLANPASASTATYWQSAAAVAHECEQNRFALTACH